MKKLVIDFEKRISEVLRIYRNGISANTCLIVLGGLRSEIVNSSLYDSEVSHLLNGLRYVGDIVFGYEEDITEGLYLDNSTLEEMVYLIRREHMCFSDAMDTVFSDYDTDNFVIANYIAELVEYDTDLERDW